MPDLTEAIKFRMEQMGMKKMDLVEVVRFTSRVSEILSKKRKLTLNYDQKIKFYTSNFHRGFGSRLLAEK
jgi:HTH-type transcriptional regulator/antitoxin HigA